MRARYLWLGVLVLALLSPAATAAAQAPLPGSDGSHIFVDQDVSLKATETFHGDLGIFRGTLNTAQGSTVEGTVFITGGGAVIAGRVHGNVAIFGASLNLTETGQVTGDLFVIGDHTVHQVAGHVGGNLSVLFGDLNLGSTAVVDGDLMVSPSRLQRAAGAQVRGKIVSEPSVSGLPFTSASPKSPAVPEVTPFPQPRPALPGQGGFPQQLGRLVARIAITAVFGLAFLAVSLLVVAVWPRATRRVAGCLGMHPAPSLGLGLLTLLLAVGLQALAAVLAVVIILIAALLMGTVILIPAGLLLILLSGLLLLPVPLVLAAAMLLGWLGLAELIGQKVLKALRARTGSTAAAAVVGLIIVGTLAALLWNVAPLLCGWPFVTLLACLGLGAVFQSRFGRRDCLPPKARPAAESLPPTAMDAEAGQPDRPSSGN